MPGPSPPRRRSLPLFCALYYLGVAALVWGGFRAAAGASHAALLLGAGVLLAVASLFVAPPAPSVDAPDVAPAPSDPPRAGRSRAVGDLPGGGGAEARPPRGGA